LLHVLHSNGNLFCSFGARGLTAPAIADIDLDGRNELIMMHRTHTTFIYAVDYEYDFYGMHSAKPEWGQFGRDASRTSFYPPPPAVTQNVDLTLTALGPLFTTPGSTVRIPISYENNGAALATSVTLTATLDSGLVYLSDSFPVPPIVNGNSLTWNLGNLAYPFQKSFYLWVRLADGVGYNQHLPVMFLVASQGPEANPADNFLSVDILSGWQLYFAQIFR
jgi:uncharacterized repeat protein (TIGR01451 family)